MRKSYKLSILFLLFCVITTNASSPFYYGSSGTIPLKIDSTKVIIKFNNYATPDDQNSFYQQFSRIVDIDEDSMMINGFISLSLSTGESYDNFLDSLKNSSETFLVEPYYLSESGFPAPVGVGFCVSFDINLSRAEIDNIIAPYNITIDRELLGMPNVFVLNNSDLSGYNLLDLANIFYNLPETIYSHPDFSIAIEKHGYMLYDLLHEFQPHIKKVIGEFNVASVWDFAGLVDTIIVAVVDDGVTGHDDLPLSRLLPGYDFVGTNSSFPFGPIPDSDPSPGLERAHGMACARIIASSHTTDSLINNLSTISLNPNIKVLPIKIFDDFGNAFGMQSSHFAEVFNYARLQGADVIANSWSHNGLDDIMILNAAIDSAYLYGRNGLGCPIIFSAGNNGNVPFDHDVRYPGNLPNCFSVGSVQLDDAKLYYSAFSPELDIVAPSGDIVHTNGKDEIVYGDVWSIDQMGLLGKIPNINNNCALNDYECSFGGTSAAAPIVAGVASLILAKDPTLTSQQVYEILRESAVKDLDWGTIPDTPSIYYGYGRVDAFRAILSLSHGDVNNSGYLSVTDLVALVNYMFNSGPEPFPSILLGDVNCSGEVNQADITALLNYMFNGGSPPLSPCFEF